MAGRLRGLSLVAAFATAASLAGVDVCADPAWTSPTVYAGGAFAAGSCVTSDGAIYCIGGANTDQVWFAPLDAGVVGPWQETAPFGDGSARRGLACGIDDGFVYCVGGVATLGASSAAAADAWFAPITSSGLGVWQQTTGLDTGIRGHSCVTRNAFLYCVGGLEGAHGESPVNTVRYAPLSPGGIGSWRATSSYGLPVASQSCVAAGRYLYCVGGVTAQHSLTSDVWYSHVEDDGSLRPWMRTTAYGGGAVAGASCAAIGWQITCVGGSANEVWAAPLSPLGVGAWSRRQDYPGESWYPACVADTHAIYCVGGGADPAGQSSSSLVATYVSNRGTDSDASTLDAAPADRADDVLDRHVAVAADATSAVGQPGSAPAAPTVESWNASMPLILGALDALSIADGGSAECASIATATVTRDPSTCHASAIAVSLDAASAAYAGTVTVSANVTDTSNRPAPLGDEVVFDDNGGGGMFRGGGCRQNGGALTCSATYKAPTSGRQVTITAEHHDAFHSRALASTVLPLTGFVPRVTVTSSANPSLSGEAVRFGTAIAASATVTGTVVFDVDGVALGQSKTDLKADNLLVSSDTATLTVGLHTVTAAYSGGVSLDEKVALVAASNGTLTQQVIAELKDERSCRALGGRWAATDAICAVPRLAVDDGNSVQVDAGVTLTSGDPIAIDWGGLLVNRGRITTAQLTIGSGGHLINYGTIAGEAAIVTDPAGVLTNHGTIENERGPGEQQRR